VGCSVAMGVLLRPHKKSGFAPTPLCNTSSDFHLATPADT
jgi:hypothetical protein